VTLPKKSWRITKVANSARKNLNRLGLEIQENILIKIECLEYNPYQSDVRKVQGKDDIFRLRVEDYGIYYRVRQDDRTIEILFIGHKAAIKEKIIQRL
jgi:mRNA interferase RelE/StbE